MPLLEAAFVNLSDRCKDVCLNYDSGVFCGANDNTCKYCVPISASCSSHCVLLDGISHAKHLKLISEIGKVCHSSITTLCYRLFCVALSTYLTILFFFQPIFTRDLKHCPKFSKLKTLLLNEYWFEAPDLDPLACIMKNSPVVEKLTLQLFSKGPNHEVEMKGSYSSMEGPSAISEHLKIVEVKCNVVDKRILKVLRFLSALNILDLGRENKTSCSSELMLRGMGGIPSSCYPE
uniref:Uncharacterized protein n=1 Tax=Aegilops tauschii subsp. strangulata TaxID=200361 RepID=A0A453N114_AEGTS